jgi:N-acetylglutamate synthase-like GNAT family acetyltransferase
LRRVFPSGLPDDPDALIATITQVDYSNSFGLMASGPDGDVAGAAHYTRLPLSSDGGTTATVIVAVHPQWRRAGLARELLWTLATRAQECGISEFTGVTSPDNDAFFRLIGDPGTRRVENATAVPVSMVIDWSRAPGY